MQTALITGANRGIGLELVRAVLARGDRVLATARLPADAAALKATGADVLALNVACAASVADLKVAIGGQPIDLLINNAGVGDRAGFGATDFDRFAEVLSINALGPIRVMEAFADNIAAGQGRMIAAISSQLGSIETTTGDAGLIYRTSKAALNMALRSAASAMAARGITLLALHPGWVRTDMGGSSAPVMPDESAAGLLRVIAGAGPSPSLRFLDYQGNTLPW